MLQEYSSYSYSEIQSCLPESYRAAPGITDKVFSETKRYGKEVLHLTSCGLKVRSKSEMMIVEHLLAHGLDFVYERPLRIKDENGSYKVIHPDFAFKTRYGEWIYWERFGMLGKEEYREDAVWKFERYISNGIIPSVNFLMTAETLDGALDTGTILRTIETLKSML